MSYFLVSENGYVGDVASINGYAEMCTVVRTIKPYGHLAEFLNDGQTRDIQEVIRDIEDIVSHITIQSVRNTLEELKGNLGKVTELAIITQ
jgi:hypothetical protein